MTNIGIALLLVLAVGLLIEPVGTLIERPFRPSLCHPTSRCGHRELCTLFAGTGQTSGLLHLTMSPGVRAYDFTFG